jgi:dipeptidyl aminopeptidase/acylaminoacyl peptidase
VSGGEAKDITPGNRDVPPFSLGGPDDYAISPDGAEVVYAAISDDVPAISTNSDLYVVPISGGEPAKITLNPGADNSPAYSPDGKYLAWRTQLRPGYESDRWRLVTLERATGKLTSLTEGTYYADIELEVAGDVRRVDSRPSDAIALALRAKVPILVNEDVLQQVAKETKDAPVVAFSSDDADKWTEMLEKFDLDDTKYKM